MCNSPHLTARQSQHEEAGEADAAACTGDPVDVPSQGHAAPAVGAVTVQRVRGVESEAQEYGGAVDGHHGD
jgi:hypothetical protein